MLPPVPRSGRSMQNKRCGVRTASWPGDSLRCQPRALGLIANLFILFLLVAPTAGPTFPLVPPRFGEASSAAPRVERSRSDEITSSVDRTSERPAELRLRFGALPHAPAVRAVPEQPLEPGRLWGPSATGTHDPGLLRRHLSAGILLPYRSTAPPQS